MPSWLSRINTMSRRSRPDGVLSAQQGVFGSTAVSPSIPRRTLQGHQTQECKDEHRSCVKEEPQLEKDVFQCSCMSTCSQFGNCCLDSAIENVPQLDCVQPLLSIQPELGISVISKCPKVNDSTIADAEVRQLCENITSSSKIDLALPVTSSVSEITYRNLFCAICNGVPRSEWTLWSLNSSLCVLSSDFLLDDALKKCTFRVIPPAGVKSITYCDTRVIGDCPSYWSNLNVQEKCKRYYAPLASGVESGAIYKNRFCAFCNGISPGVLRCSNGSSKPAVRTSTPLLTSTLSILLDVDQSQGGGDMVGFASNCPPGHQSLSWKINCPVCKNIMNMFIRCFRVHRSSDSVVLNCTESDVHILADVPFTVDVNHSLILNDSHESYLSGQYKILANNSVIVCSSKNVFTTEKYSHSQRILTIICLSISVACLVVRLVLIFIKKRPLSVPKCIQACLCTSLLFSHLIFLVSNEGWTKQVCTALSILNHYAQIMSLTWSLTLALDIYKTFSKTFERYSSRKTELRKYIFTAVFVPAAPVSLACVVEFASDWEHLRPRYGPDLCWLNNRNALLVFFVFPVVVLLVGNGYLFARTAWRIFTTAKSAETARNKSNGQRKKAITKLSLYVKLAVLMGLTWSFGIVAAYGRNDVLWYIFVIGHGLQGTYLLLGFTSWKILSCNIFHKKKSLESTRRTSSLNDLRGM